MKKKKLHFFDIAIKVLLLLFAILLIVLLVYIIVFSKFNTAGKAIGSGISVFAIVGTIMVAIFKNELDKAEDSERKDKIMEYLIKILGFFKKEKDEKGRISPE